MAYKTVLIGMHSTTDAPEVWNLHEESEKILLVEDDDGNVIETNDHDEELVTHLQEFAPAYKYLFDNYEKTLVKKAFDDMSAADVVHFATQAGLLCADNFNEAVKKFEEEGAFVIYEPKAEQKGGSMYAYECKELIKKIVKEEGWDSLYRLIEHKDFMTFQNHPVLL